MSTYPTVAANTLLPERDRACWELAQHLRDRLNEEYKAIAQELTNPILGDTPVVKKCLDWNAWSNTNQDFPLLAVYRRFERGEDLDECEATIAYYLSNIGIMAEHSGILAWVRSKVVRSLQSYNSFGMGDRHAYIKGGYSSEYGIGVTQSGVGAFPYVRINFNFQEIGV